MANALTKDMSPRKEGEGNREEERIKRRALASFLKGLRAIKETT